MSAAQTVICSRFGPAIGTVEEAARLVGRSPSKFTAWATTAVAESLLDAVVDASPSQRAGEVTAILVALRWEPKEAAA